MFCVLIVVVISSMYITLRTLQIVFEAILTSLNWSNLCKLFLDKVGMKKVNVHKTYAKDKHIYV